MRKKDKELHKLNESDIDIVVKEDTSKKKKRKHKLMHNSSLETSETCNEQSMIEEPCQKKSKKKSKKNSDQSDEISEIVESQSSSPPKKMKKEKKKKPAEESLGVVDTDILQQAKVNLGLNIADPVSPQKENVDEEQSSKQKKKKRKDKKSQDTSTIEPNERNRNERAVEYLRLWNENRQTWKFNKMMQVQLFHIMYDKSMMNNEDFEVLLLYLDGLKGKGREKTKEDAKKILEKEETEETVDTDKEDRARQIFQMLA